MTSKELLREARAVLTPAVPKEPRRRLAVIACMDARVDPWRIFRAAPGDIHTLRNAGGVATDDVIRSLVVAQHSLGVRNVVILMHTDCGMQGLDEDRVNRELGELISQPVKVRLAGFTDLSEELHAGVERLRQEPLLSEIIHVTGQIYDVDTGQVRSVIT